MKGMVSSELPVLSAAAERDIRVLPTSELRRVKRFFDVVHDPDRAFTPIEIKGSGLFAADISRLGDRLSSDSMDVRFGDERRRKIVDKERPLVVVYRTARDKGSPRLVIERIFRDSLEDVLDQETDDPQDA